jgi:hypothetical protein
MTALGLSQAPHAERGHDLYETPPEAVHGLLSHEWASHLRHAPLWEPCAGRGAILRELRKVNYDIRAEDLCAYEGADPAIISGIDFLSKTKPRNRIIVTNPPFMIADKFVRHAMTLAPEAWFLLRWAYAEGTKKADIIDNHLDCILLGRERLPMMHREGYEGKKLSSSGAPFAWFRFLSQPRSRTVRVERVSWRVQS